METITNTIKSDSEIIVVNNFIESLDNCLGKINLISKILASYEENQAFKNFEIEIEFELLKLNIKYFDNILTCFLGFKSDENETHQIKMLKLNDFISYEYKRLRNKYEEIAELYFSLDQENKYVNNIKKFMETTVFKPNKIGCLYLKLINHYFGKIEKYLNFLYQKEFKTSYKEKEKFHIANRKIMNLCNCVYSCLFMNEEEILKFLKSNERLMQLTKFNFLEVEDNKNKWLNLFSNFFQNVYSKIRTDKFDSGNILSGIKSGLYSIINNFTTDSQTKLKLTGMLPEIKIIKLMFQDLEQQTQNSSLLTISGEPCKINEVFYLPLKNLEKMKLLNEKEAMKKIDISGNSNLMKIRILTNQLIKVNYELQLLLNHKNFDISNKREINFFGLLLKVSKEMLIPNCNVIFHINGGGFLSQSSESHLSYLNKWATETDSVIISLDYKLSSDNKYPLLLDSCSKAYETITNHSMKLFNFNINKLILYSDSVGSLIALDIIKYAIGQQIKIPDAAVFVFPIPTLINEIDKEDPLAYLRIEESCIYSKIRESFIDLERDELLDYNKDHRLNFLLTNPVLLKNFPQVFILSAANEPIKENSSNLFRYLVKNNVNVSFKQLMYYSYGFLQISSITENYYKNTLEYALNYIQDVFNDVSLSISHQDEKTIFKSRHSVMTTSNSNSTSSLIDNENY